METKLSEGYENAYFQVPQTHTDVFFSKFSSIRGALIRQLPSKSNILFLSFSPTPELSYETILDKFWHQIAGIQESKYSRDYIIYFSTDKQRVLAESSAWRNRSISGDVQIEQYGICQDESETQPIAIGLSHDDQSDAAAAAVDINLKIQGSIGSESAKLDPNVSFAVAPNHDRNHIDDDFWRSAWKSAEEVTSKFTFPDRPPEPQQPWKRHGYRWTEIKRPTGSPKFKPKVDSDRKISSPRTQEALPARPRSHAGRNRGVNTRSNERVGRNRGNNGVDLEKGNWIAEEESRVRRGQERGAQHPQAPSQEQRPSRPQSGRAAQRTLRESQQSLREITIYDVGTTGWCVGCRFSLPMTFFISPPSHQNLSVCLLLK